MPTTGFLIQNTDIGVYFGAKGASTAAATGFKVQGTDLNALLLARADGLDIGLNTSYDVGGTDLRSVFGAPTGNTPLPINGQHYAASAQSGTVSSVANLIFATTSAGVWSLTRTQSPGSGGTLATGSVPSGTTSVAYNLNVTSSTTSTSSSNSAPSQTSLSSSPSASIQANGTPSSPERDIAATLTINYYNASNNIISTTVIYLTASATGAS